jgi:hydrogenase nickel incorporation protein HypB
MSRRFLAGGRLLAFGQGAAATDVQHVCVEFAQVNTDPGFGGECHLDANMVRHGLPALPLNMIDVLIIENVGNLVCPAEFKVGEDSRVMVFSVTEGEDKPLKYPLMFRSAQLVLINKIDLLPHLDLDMERLTRNLAAVNPGAQTILMSARTGEGVDEWCSWLRTRQGGAG